MAISTEGTYQDFGYSASIQSFTVPQDGIYKLEVWGGQGGSIPSGNAGGKGGYSVGYKKLTEGTILYIVTGGAGVGYDNNDSGTFETIAGGYNGGGRIIREKTFNWNGEFIGGRDISTGGGATHIATATGLLSALSGNKSAVLIVAGGGGGAVGTNRTYGGAGGAGGGTNGGDGEYGTTLSSGYNGKGGTQSKAGNNGASDRELVSGGFGYGGYIASGEKSYISGGGGGYYGGGCTGAYSGAGGGSGYIGGVPSFTDNGGTYSPSMTSGSQSGNGKARITYYKSDGLYNLYYNETQVKAVNRGSASLSEVKYKDTTYFKK